MNNNQKISQISPAVRMMLMENDGGVVKFSQNEKSFDISLKNSDDIENIYKELSEKVEAYKKANNKNPKSVMIDGVGVFSYFSNQSSDAKRLNNKICVVTGSAQGFGKGLAEQVAEQGAFVVIADLNESLAKAVSDEINNKYGQNSATFVKVDVSEEASVQNMIDETVQFFGGLDIFVNNAGVLKAGSLEEMDLKSFDFVTKINYTAYYLCTKYASRVMKLQNKFNKSYYTDIIQINSKSGLSGSNKNFAYAGGKFGGIGLTQSFAMELVDYNIKVNSICPGNFFDGPLWSNPENGLFVQYLKANKVPGAKTIEDVKKFYEEKVPMKRGCESIDVARALFYIVEQRYETGQAVPVTGGQNMLK